jgi:hypothetical protein
MNDKWSFGFAQEPLNDLLVPQSYPVFLIIHFDFNSFPLKAGVNLCYCLYFESYFNFLLVLIVLKLIAVFGFPALANAPKNFILMFRVFIVIPLHRTTSNVPYFFCNNKLIITNLSLFQKSLYQNITIRFVVFFQVII